MKTPLLVLLTVVNIFWSTGLFFRPSPSPQSGESPAVLREDAHGNPPGRPATDRHASNAWPALAETQPFDWRCVESTDYRHYIKNLRAIGCPEMTIRDLITADVRSLFRQRRAALLAQEPVRFWTASYGQEEATPAWQALVREEDMVLQELLGRDYPAATAAGSAEESESSLRLGAGLESKRAALESWRDHFAMVGEELQARASERELTSSEEARVRQLEREMDQALGEILTPEEKEEFNVRNSPLAQDLRESLLGFEVSEAEFRSLLRARQHAEGEVACGDWMRWGANRLAPWPNIFGNSF